MSTSFFLTDVKQRGFPPKLFSHLVIVRFKISDPPKEPKKEFRNSDSPKD